jgi:hypothetical protein
MAVFPHPNGTTANSVPNVQYFCSIFNSGFFNQEASQVLMGLLLGLFTGDIKPMITSPVNSLLKPVVI